MNKLNRNRPIDTEKELMVARGEAGGGMGKEKNLVYSFNNTCDQVH